MGFQKPLLLVLTCALVSATGCQLIVAPFRNLGKKSQAIKPPQSTSSQAKQKGVVDKEFVAYRQEILHKFETDEFSWIDNEARKVRATKDRIPGGYFKLRTLYKALEAPKMGSEASSGEWEDHIAHRSAG